MAYSFYLDGYALPFAPPSMRLSWPGRNETIDLINDGEANIPRAPGLQQIEFEARIPNEAYSFATYPTGWIDADRFRALLESLHGGKQPFRFIASRAMGSKLLFDTNLMVTLESWDMNEDWEEGFDAIFPITLKAYKAFATKTAQIVAPAASAPMIVTSQTRASGATTPSDYTVVKGDCLSHIAQRMLGDSSRWREIYDLNKGQIDNPNLIFPGQVFKLPS